MTRFSAASTEAPRVPARRKRGRHVVVVGLPPRHWHPSDPGDVPADGLAHSEPLVADVTLTQGIAEAHAFNRDAMVHGGELWAVVLFRANCRAKGGSR